MLIRKVVGYEDELRFDTSKPDGTPSKLKDVSKLHNLGFQTKIPHEEGLRKVYENFKTEVLTESQIIYRDLRITTVR